MSSPPKQSPSSSCPSGPANRSGSHKRRKSQNKLLSDRVDRRIYIGKAFKGWQALKCSQDFRSDAELALHLLNERKKLSPILDSAGASDMEPKSCPSEVQGLIEQEVHKALAKKERGIQNIIQHIQDTGNENGFETSIQKLERRIDAISSRAEVALAHIANTQKQSSSSSTENADVLRESQEDDPMETVSQNKKKTNGEAKNGKIPKIMETTRSALVRFCADNELLTTAIAELDPEDPPPVLTPWGSPDSKETKKGLSSSNEAAEADMCERKPLPCLTPFDSSEGSVKSESVMELVSAVKTERTDFYNKDHEYKKEADFEQPKAKRTKTEYCSPDHSSSRPAPKEVEGKEPMKDAEDVLFYPLLPPNPFPPVLEMEAASYSMPQKVVVNLAFIRNPTRISVLWNVEDEDPCAPPMESYTILLAMETKKGSGVFNKWDKYDKLEAKSLPMCALIQKYKHGHRLCAAVVGKDIFGRYGPYSEVATAIVPD